MASSEESIMQNAGLAWHQTTIPPDAPCDPIAIAAMVAAIPELEAEYIKAEAESRKRLEALNDMQERIDDAVRTLRRKAPEGSSWKKPATFGQMGNIIKQKYGQHSSQGAIGSGSLGYAGQDIENGT